MDWKPDLPSVSTVERLVVRFVLPLALRERKALPMLDPNWLGLKYFLKKTFRDGAEAQMIPKLASTQVVT
jgi:hypothetical protein